MAGLQFKTPSGKYEFTSMSKGDEGRLTLAVPEESKWENPELAEKYPYSLLTIHPLSSNHSQNYHLFPKAPKVKVEVAKNIAKDNSACKRMIM